MTSKGLANPFFRQIAKRGYAQAVPSIKEPQVQSSILPTNTFIAALDNCSPVTRVTVAFRAGSRYEAPTERGIAHVLRASAGLTTAKASSFIIARKLAQSGVNFTCSGDRELIYYTVETTQENLQPALECLNNIISNQEFRPWELGDNAPRLRYEVSGLPPQVGAVDLLHKAAFRRGLGNSLYIPPKRIDSISSESLKHYVACNLTPDRCAVTVVGDTQDQARLVAQSLQLSTRPEKSAQEPSVYHGGEMRKETGGDLAHVALAVRGAPAGTPQSLALAIAAKALGSGPVTKWGADNSPLAAAIGNIGPFAAAGFNVSYSDDGLFGVVLSVPKDEALSATKALASVLRNSTLPSNVIKAGKNQLKLQVLSESENSSSLSECLAAQGLYTGRVRTASELAKDIDSIPESEVCSALAKALSTKMSMGAAGNLAFVPYVDEL